ncbi:MAG TPA: PilZ domain-containing protein [Gemmataceae bacterium]|nr:PilZ domain-containing protein [Gemmataceae bacterium]
MPDSTIPLSHLKKSLVTEERRARVRYPVDLDTSFRSLGQSKDEGSMARVWDISTLGISLLLDRRIEPGTTLVVELTKRPAISRVLLSRVKHATEHQNGSWVIGCEFIGALTDSELQALL